MISQAMQIFRDVLHDSLQAYGPERPVRVRIGRVKDPNPDGDAALVLSMVNLAVDGRSRLETPRVLPPLHLTVLLSTSPGLCYASGLQLLSTALRIFHMKPVLTRQADPELLTEFERITITPVTLDLDVLRGIWSLQGAPYQPSMVYELCATPLKLRPAASWVQPVSARMDLPR